MYWSVLGSSFTLTETKQHEDERTTQARPGIKRVFCSVNSSAGVTAVWIYCPPFKAETAKQNICGGHELETTGTDVTVTHSLSPANFNWTFIFGRSCATLRDPAPSPPPPPEAGKLRPTHDCNLPEGIIGQCFLKCDSRLSGDPGMIKSLSVFYCKHLNYKNYQKRH